MKLKDKKRIISTITGISRYLYQFDYRFRDRAPRNWNPVLFFPGSAELVDPYIVNPEQSDAYADLKATTDPWSSWNLRYGWEVARKIIETEMESMLLEEVTEGKFITCERKSASETIIGFFYYHERANTRLLIEKMEEFTGLTYADSPGKLEEITRSRKPTILNSDTLLAKTFELISDYTLFPVRDENVMWICKMFSFKPLLSDLFRSYKEIG